MTRKAALLLLFPHLGNEQTNERANALHFSVPIPTKQWEKRTSFALFVVVVQLIHRLTQADISCKTTARLFFFPLLDSHSPIIEVVVPLHCRHAPPGVLQLVPQRGHLFLQLTRRCRSRGGANRVGGGVTEERQISKVTGKIRGCANQEALPKEVVP